MNILFVHQAFPGQYIHICRYIGSTNANHQIASLGIEPAKVELPTNIQSHYYLPKRNNTQGIHPLALETESKVIRGQACAAKAFELKSQGFFPDLICAHPGWGEALFLKEVWPNSKLLTYQEFFYQSKGFDLDFDSELQTGNDSIYAAMKARMKNANVLLNLEASDWSVTPTYFQKSSFPHDLQSQLSVIHDGIDTRKASPRNKPTRLDLPCGTTITTDSEVITFVNRTIEPYRGCHTMIRAIPYIQDKNPDAHIIIVGAKHGVSYGRACAEGEWMDYFLKEIQGQYNTKRLHFTGSLPYETYLEILRLSSVHVYLTYPFVMSWSLLEAMSTGCAVVGSRTAPVMEVIEDGVNGRLVDFFSPQELADRVHELLEDREQAKRLGRNARKTILERYELNHCVKQQIALMELVASGALSA